MVEELLRQMNEEDLLKMRENYVQAYMIQHDSFQVYMIQVIDKVIEEKKEQVRTR